MSATTPESPDDEDVLSPQASAALAPAVEAQAWAAPSLAGAATDDPAQISAERILLERPDVLRGFYEAYYAGGGRGSAGWAERVGGDTPEAYALYWYEQHGRYEGYNQGPTTAQDNISLARILVERPDVLRAFYEEFHGPNNDRKSSAWMDRVGGDTPEAYAKYWYEKHGRWEGYAQSEKAAAEAIDVHRILIDRPDVLRGFYEAFYGPNNDRKSSAWMDRVGGDTPEAYARYWYETHGWREGYTQRAPEPPASPPDEPPDPDEPAPPAPIAVDPSLDPWNHPAIYPNWPNPEPGTVTLEAEAPGEEAIVVIGGGSAAIDPFGFGS